MARPWLAPDAHAEEGIAAPAATEPAPPPAAPQKAPSPVPLRPMTVADILDGGIAVIKGAPRIIFVIAGVFVVPTELLSAWVHRDTLADRGLSGALSAATSSNSATADISVSTVLLLILSGFVLSLITGAVAHLMSGWYADRVTSAGDAIRASLRAAPALVVAWCIVHLLEAVATAALVVPLAFVMPLFAVTAPAIVVEHLGPIAGVRRSWRLTRVRYSAVLGATLLIAVVSTILTIALSGVGLAFSFLSFGWIVDVAAQAASSLVSEPFVAAATTLVYLDLRIRTEGLDLDLDITEHFASAG